MQKCVAGGEGGVMLAAGRARVSFSPSRSRVPVKISHLGGNFIHFLYTLWCPDTLSRQAREAHQ